LKIKYNKFTSLGSRHNHSGALHQYLNAISDEELFNLIDKEEAIRVLVLGVSTEHGNPGPLINYIINKGSNQCRVPITIVPGNLTDEQIDALV